MRFPKNFLTVLLVFGTFASCGKNDVPASPVTPVPPVNTNTTFTNPLLSSGPDPWVIQKDSFYYYMHTLGNKIAIWKTKAMSQLNVTNPVTVWSKPVSGPNSQNVWAPELHYFDGKWYMYYTAGSTASTDNQRIFVLENSASDPTQGTWVDKGEIKDSTADFWAIDATVFEQNGNRYILWSGHADAIDNTQRIYIARLLNPWTMATVRTLISSPQFSWESIGSPPAVNEGPEILANSSGKIFLIFSASGCWTDDYTLGLSALKDGGDPLNAADWVKAADAVFTKKPENNTYGPGHCAFFKSKDGTQDWIVYHANSSANQGCMDYRNPRMQIFTWNADGTPNFGTPLKTNTAILKPSGE